jgi:peroxiredoxin
VIKHCNETQGKRDTFSKIFLTTTPKQEAFAPLMITGQPAPDFQLLDLEGNWVHLSDFRGQPILLNFWSAECPWAKRTDSLLALLQVPNLVILSIASNGNEPLDLLRRTAQERSITHVLRDPDHQVADLYAAETTPHLFLINAQGSLHYQGAYDDISFHKRTATRSYLLEALQALHAGQTAPVPQTPAYGCTIVRFSEE